MTVIDVNLGKFVGFSGNLEQTVTQNNLEAAEEIVRQLRLRDVGGIIVIDFIDMVLESNRDLVLRRLTECLGRDRAKHQVAEVTSLGLVQMTRKRVGAGIGALQEMSTSEGQSDEPARAPELLSFDTDVSNLDVLAPVIVLEVSDVRIPMGLDTGAAMSLADNEWFIANGLASHTDDPNDFDVMTVWQAGSTSRVMVRHVSIAARTEDTSGGATDLMLDLWLVRNWAESVFGGTTNFVGILDPMTLAFGNLRGAVGARPTTGHASLD